MSAERHRGLWAAAAAVAVAGSLVAAIVHLGPPAERRRLRLDTQRVSSLQSLRREIETFLEREGRLPAELAALAEKPWADAVPKDPVTHRAFEYQATGPRRYRLCAEFDRPSPRPEPNSGSDFWTHPQGHHCYEIGVEAKVAPTAKP